MDPTLQLEVTKTGSKQMQIKIGGTKWDGSGLLKKRVKNSGKRLIFDKGMKSKLSHF